MYTNSVANSCSSSNNSDGSSTNIVKTLMNINAMKTVVDTLYNKNNNDDTNDDNKDVKTSTEDNSSTFRNILGRGSAPGFFRPRRCLWVGRNDEDAIVNQG